MIQLPEINPREGLTIEEMVKIAREADPDSWIEYNCWDSGSLPCEYLWFSYDYYGRRSDIGVYLSYNSAGSLFSNYLAIKLTKGDIAIGFSGRLKEKKCPTLKELYFYVKKCVKNNLEARAKREIERTKAEIKKVREDFIR